MADKKNYWKGMTFSQKVDYFFQYYLGWVIGTVVIIIFVGLYFYYVNLDSDPDMYVTVIGPVSITQQQNVDLENYFSGMCGDVNYDQVSTAEISDIFHSYSSQLTGSDAAETNSAYETRFYSEIATGIPRIIIMSPDHYQVFLNDEQFEGLLTDLSELSDNTVDKYGVLVSDTTLAELDFIPKDYLVGVTMVGAGKQDDQEMVMMYTQLINVFSKMIITTGA